MNAFALELWCDSLNLLQISVGVTSASYFRLVGRVSFEDSDVWQDALA